jgi:hypothetical protein
MYSVLHNILEQIVALVFYIVYGKDDGHADESLKLEWKGK